jgi:hypothetical protein
VFHVHIGPSPLALGLLIPCAKAAGFAVYVIGRPGDDSPTQYGLVGTGPEDLLSYPRVDGFEGPGSFQELSEEVCQRVESQEPLLLTCTLREMIAERRPFVEAILQARPSAAETIFLPCENAPHEAYLQLSEVCEETGALALRTVVNRMCTEDKRDSEGRRMVAAHSLGEWLIERPPAPCPLLEALERAVDEVSQVDDYEARQARKLWMVNGAHQALALMAWAATERTLGVIEKTYMPMRRSDDLRDAARGIRVSARLHHLHSTMDDALLHAYPSLRDNLEYGIEHVVAYSEHPDSVKRVLGAFRRQDLAPFIETMKVRLGRPAEISAQMDRSVSPFTFVMDVFENLALNLDAFLDVAEIRADLDLIDPNADERALAAYAQLLGGWTSATEVEERVQRLASAFASHR